MKVKEALDKGYFRIVPLNESGSWYVPYKGKPLEDYHEHAGETMYVIKTGKACTFLKNATSLRGKTYVSPSGTAIVYTGGDQQKVPGKASTQFKVTIDETFLEAEIASASDDAVSDSVLTFNVLAFRLLQGQSLNETELASLVECPDTYQVLAKETLLETSGVRGTDLLEVVRACASDSFRPEGDRARLLVWERAHDIARPLALNLYGKDTILRKAVKLP